MRLTCPWCGPRDIEEFSFGGDASVPRPALAETDPDAWHSYLFARDNPKGAHREFWHHERGCRQWIIAERNTATHQVGEFRLASGGDDR